MWRKKNKPKCGKQWKEKDHVKENVMENKECRYEEWKGEKRMGNEETYIRINHGRQKKVKEKNERIEE